MKNIAGNNVPYPPYPPPQRHVLFSAIIVYVPFLSRSLSTGKCVIEEMPSIPVISSVGEGNLEHIYGGFTKGRADAALADSMFHSKEDTITPCNSDSSKR